MSTVAGVLGLAGIYALALGSTKPADLATGVLLGLIGVVLERRVGRGRVHSRAPAPVKAAAMAGMAATTVREIVLGTIHVTAFVLGLRKLRAPGIVEVPVGDRTSAGIAVTGILCGMPPGDLFVDSDPDRGVMLVHVLDASDPEAVCERYRRFYERQRKVVP